MPALRRKPAISAPGDAFEREADDVADKVMRMAEPTLTGSTPATIQRKCAACEDDEEKSIQTKRTAFVSADMALDAGAAARTAACGGTPLSKELRAYFEPRFGHDFSQVRVHADGEAASAARGVQARAYALGSHIVFGAGEYAPATVSGKQLLAHELAHVVQQGATNADSASLPLQRKPSSEQAARVEADHRTTQQRVYQLLEPDTSWDYLRRGDPPPTTLTPEQRARDPHVLFNNSVAWIRSRRIALSVLTPVPEQQDPDNLTLFDPAITYPDLGGSVDSTTILAKNVDADTNDQRMQLVVKPGFTGSRLRELLRHEVQHVADAHTDAEATKKEQGEFRAEQSANNAYHGDMNTTIWNSYKTEFRGYWLESIARGSSVHGVHEDGSSAESGGSGPGGRGGVDTYGSEMGRGGELKVSGHEFLKSNPLYVPEATIQLQNEKQTRIANHIVHNYFGMEETFLTSPLFRSKIQNLVHPESVNLVNSLRIERLHKAMHAATTRTSIWLKTIPREQDVADAVNALNETDVAFLKDRNSSGPFWEDAKRQMAPAFVAWMEGYVLQGNKDAAPPVPAAPLQRKPSASATGGRLEGETDAAAQAAGHDGRPLSEQTRSFFEPLFGQDFSGVRVHVDAAAAHAARAIHARAYTVGSDIAFGSGEYAPHTTAGRKLLAHELTHVVQQDRCRSGLVSAGLSSPDHAAEREADAAAEAVVAGRAFAPHATPAAGLHRKMHNKVLLETLRPAAKACLVHLHGEEHTAAGVAQELYGRRCVNYVHLDTDQGPLTGIDQRFVEFDVDVNSVNFTCKADPNRVFSDKGRGDDATHKWITETVKEKDKTTGKEKSKKVSKKVVNCRPTNASSKTAGISDADIEKAAAAELKTFADSEWAAAISKCRGGSGTPDLAGPLAVLALHNNEGGDKPADSILTKYTGQWDKSDPRVTPDANPNFSADKGKPSDVFFVTRPADYAAIKSTFNVGIQALPVPVAGEDGSLSVALQKDRFINVEKKGRDHAALVKIGSGFKGHDSVYIKNYAMAVKALDVLGVPEGACSPATPAAAPQPAVPVPARAPQSPSPTGARSDAAFPTKGTDPAKGKAEAEAKKKTEPYPLEKVADKGAPFKDCLHFDAATIGSKKSQWAARMATLPVLDVINWIVGAWNLDSKFPKAMPGVVQDGVNEAFKQRACLLAAMKSGVKAQGGNVPAGPLIASGARSFEQQREIWDDKWNFRGVKAPMFDRISKSAATKSAGLLVEGAPWKTKDPIHKLMWGVIDPAISKDDVDRFIKAGAASLTLQEREGEILMASSAPGVSRHHAGTDFDIGQTGTGNHELEPELWKPGEEYFDLDRWLLHNAATWGFMRPFETKGGYGKGYMAEPWHWSYWPIAQALLEFARENRTDMEDMLHAHWQKPGAAPAKASGQFEFIWAAWKNFLNNVDETPRF
ncbi:MAG: DUF4157 domain-containing protein [Dokdonella sp.]